MLNSVARLKGTLLRQLEYDPADPQQPRREAIVLLRNDALLLVKLLEHIEAEVSEVNAAHEFLLKTREAKSRLGRVET